MQSTLTKELDRLFHPASMAHVGASDRENVGRFNFTEYFLKMKFPGRIYPVNPKYQEVLGLPCYPTLADIPGEVDLAYISVPAALSVKVLQDCPPGKLRFAVIHTSGYGEIGKEDLEQELLQEARQRGIRLIGPNCMGIYSQEGRIGCWRSHHEIVEHKGSVGFISQSGGHALDLLQGGPDSDIFFNKAVSLGNQLDLSINDFLEYMGADPAIRVIGAYIEDVRDGRKFTELVRRITPEKPVIVWKGGITARGKAAAITHTGSLAGNERIFASALQQVGGILVTSLEEFRRVARLLQPEYMPAGRLLAVLSPGGGNTVSICDHFASRPFLSLPRLTPETERRLRQLLPEENVDVANPVDPGATGLAHFRELLDAVAGDPNIDTLLFVLHVEFMEEIKDENMRFAVSRMMAKEFGRINSKGKPMIILLRQLRQNHERLDSYRRLVLKDLHERGVPWVDGGFEDIAPVIEKIAMWRTYRERMAKGGTEQ